MAKRYTKKTASKAAKKTGRMLTKQELERQQQEGGRYAGRSRKKKS